MDQKTKQSDPSKILIPLNGHSIPFDEAVLSKGSHGRPAEGFCVMEMVSLLAGQPFSDHPPCVSPTIRGFLINWNDSLPDEERQLLKPYALKVIGTAAGKTEELARSYMALDWLVRVHTAAWLRLAGGDLTKHGDTLAALDQLMDAQTVNRAQPAIIAARDAAWSAARAAAWDATRSAAWSAAWAAAGGAAQKHLAHTVKELQASAFDLLDRMIALTPAEAVLPTSQGV